MTRRYPPLLFPDVTTRSKPFHAVEITNHRGRSNRHVVRLEPFFADGAVAPGGTAGMARHGSGGNAGETAPYAAAERGRGRTAAAAASNRTETRFETPDSSIVTP